MTSTYANTSLSLRLTRSRLPKIGAALGSALGATLALGLLSGCAVFQDYSGDTCDGKKPVATMEQAGKDLVTAAYADDLDGVCRVTSPFPGGKLTDDMVTKTKETLVAQGITPENVTVVVGEQMGSGLEVSLTDGTAGHEGLNLGGTIVREDGFTIGLPSELYPTDNSTPDTATEAP